MSKQDANAKMLEALTLVMDALTAGRLVLDPSKFRDPSALSEQFQLISTVGAAIALAKATGGAE